MTGKADTAGSASGKSRGMTLFSLPDFSGIRGAGPFTGMGWVTRQYAQGTLVSLDLLETWIANSRMVADAWQASLREQQDVFLATVRTQLKSSLPEGSAGPARTADAASPAAKPAPAKAREPA